MHNNVTIDFSLCFVSSPIIVSSICECHDAVTSVRDEAKCWSRIKFYSTIRMPAFNQSDHITHMYAAPG